MDVNTITDFIDNGEGNVSWSPLATRLETSCGISEWKLDLNLTNAGHRLSTISTMTSEDTGDHTRLVVDPANVIKSDLIVGTQVHLPLPFPRPGDDGRSRKSSCS